MNRDGPNWLNARVFSAECLRSPSVLEQELAFVSELKGSGLSYKNQCVGVCVCVCVCVCVYVCGRGQGRGGGREVLEAGGGGLGPKSLCTKNGPTRFSQR